MGTDSILIGWGALATTPDRKGTLATTPDREGPFALSRILRRSTYTGYYGQV